MESDCKANTYAHEASWLKSFDTAAAVEEYFGGKFVLSKFAGLETRKWPDVENSWKIQAP